MWKPVFVYSMNVSKLGKKWSIGSRIWEYISVIGWRTEKSMIILTDLFDLCLKSHMHILLGSCTQILKGILRNRFGPRNVGSSKMLIWCRHVRLMRKIKIPNMSIMGHACITNKSIYFHNKNIIIVSDVHFLSFSTSHANLVNNVIAS